LNKFLNTAYLSFGENETSEKAFKLAKFPNTAPTSEFEGSVWAVPKTCKSFLSTTRSPTM